MTHRASYLVRVRAHFVCAVAASSLVFVGGCPGPVEESFDAGSLDARVVRTDAPERDAVMVPMDDAWMVPMDDASMSETDAFEPSSPDAPMEEPDAFVPSMPDAAMTGNDAFLAWPSDPCAQIAMVRAMTGSFSTPLPVTGAVVTYVLDTLPTGSTDPSGVFVQCPGAAGPALFLAVDPGTLSPAPSVGDVVSFGVVSAADVASGAGSTGDQHRVTAISGYARTGTGGVVSPQDVSAVDLPTMIDAFESEMVTVTGTIAAAASPAGTGFTSFQITTTGVPTPSPALRVRLPTSVASALSPAPAVGCTVTVGPTPLWRFTTSAQPSAWRASEITVRCPSRLPAAGEVFFTEIGYRFAGSDDGKEFVELHNPSSSTTYDLGGCILADNRGPMHASALTLPAGLRIDPGAYLVIAGEMSEIMGAAVLPAALGLGDSDSIQLHCGGILIDDVTWTSASIGGEDEVSAQLDRDAVGPMGAMNNDMASRWCSTPMGHTYGAMGRRGTPGAPNVSCAMAPTCAPASHLVINEIDYDQPGTDNAEFIEIYNPTSAPVNLTGYSLVLINGGASGGPEYARVALSGMLPAGGYLIVTASGSSVPGATFTLPTAIQNGAPDGVLLISADGVVDAAIYEGMMTTYTLMGGMPQMLAESGSIGTDDGSADGVGLSRRPNGCDRNMPSMDWALAPITPGAANM